MGKALEKIEFLTFGTLTHPNLFQLGSAHRLVIAEVYVGPVGRVTIFSHIFHINHLRSGHDNS